MPQRQGGQRAGVRGELDEESEVGEGDDRGDAGGLGGFREDADRHRGEGGGFDRGVLGGVASRVQEVCASRQEGLFGRVKRQEESLHSPVGLRSRLRSVPEVSGLRVLHQRGNQESEGRASLVFWTRRSL